jgi:hypothetical protein
VSELFQEAQRSWREIADEASHERDPKRLIRLAEELAHALDERAKEPCSSKREAPTGKARQATQS